MLYQPGKTVNKNFASTILYEDNHLLVVNKPSGMLSQPDETGDAALDDLAREYIRVTYEKPGEVYLALLHRLDRPTSGVVLLAKTSKAAGRMADLFRQRAVDKTYLAMVDTRKSAGALSDAGTLRHFLEPVDKGGMRVVRDQTERSREARLSWSVLGRSDDGRYAALAVDLKTGVKHQIRCQLAAIGCPVVGDFRYGPLGAVARPEAILDGRAILLHAWRTGFVHPVRKDPMEIEAPIPSHWNGYLSHIEMASL